MSWNEVLTFENSKDLLISIGIMLVFLLFRKLFAKYIFSLILKLGNKAKTAFFSNIFIAVEKPIQWLFIIIGTFIAMDYFPYLDRSNPLFKHLFRSSIIILVTWCLYNLTSSTSLVFSRINDRFNIRIDDILVPFFSKAIRLIIIAISISVIAQEFGYNVNGFVAGLGIGGLAFAFAAKEALANLFGGIVIITEKPFTLGDWILTPNVEGTVEDISFRSTKIRNFEDALVTVPNAMLSNSTITNWSKMGKRRVYFNLIVSHDTPKSNLDNSVRQIRYLLKNHQGIHPDTIIVSFDEYKENGLGLLFYFFTKTTVWVEHLEVKEDINFEIMDILENEQVTYAIPSNRVLFDVDE
ncbi:mechanosensitive ion channel family protein [Filibacter tadaridae]|uniref:Low conductance mechanosensitive channel YnaI n=1 Tax=Filibacter tadaridae TaxID=2483811 RepID=A0A3P5X130_9BACL|nr:mechanosensitive ion channel family protein [Filibacter tadaridae]VDC29075.1 Low conductance mechanosensitive channel YnaI [Filibacter tadaridae]